MINESKLKECIVNAGMKINDVAKAMGLSRTGFYLKIKGKRPLTCDEVNKIVYILGMNKETALNIFFAE